MDHAESRKASECNSWADGEYYGEDVFYVRVEFQSSVENVKSLCIRVNCDKGKIMFFNENIKENIYFENVNTKY